MMKMKAILTNARTLVNKNASVIFAGAAIIGVGVTAYMIGKTSFKAGIEEERRVNELKWKQDELNKAREEDDQTHHEFEHATGKEFIMTYWRDYIPAAISGTLTVGAIVMSQIISFRQLAAMAGLYAMTNKELETVYEKVTGECGKNKAKKVKEEVVKEGIRNSHSNINEVAMSSDDMLTLFYDPMSDRYFRKSIEEVRKGTMEVAKDIASGVGVSLNDFYDAIGVSRTELGDLVGWRSCDVFDIDFVGEVAPNSEPCLSLCFDKKPNIKYMDLF